MAAGAGAVVAAGAGAGVLRSTAFAAGDKPKTSRRINSFCLWISYIAFYPQGIKEVKLNPAFT